MNAGATSQDGFVLVDAMVAIVVLAVAAVAIYQTGFTLLSRADADLDRLSAATLLHTEAKLLQAFGAPAEALLPQTDDRFAFKLLAAPASDASQTPHGFVWKELRATDPQTGSVILSLTVGYEQ